MLSFDPARPASPPIDAATLLVVRDGERSTPELLFVRRHAASPFLGGAVVFPGGKVDAGDRSARVIAGSPRRGLEGEGFAEDLEHLTALAVCACREALEEAGLLVATSKVLSAEVSRARAALAAGRTIDDALGLIAADLRLNLDALVPFARWVTPEAEARRFDARFFLAAAPEGQVAAIDARETVAVMWSSPAPMLDAFHRGDVFLAPPTLRALELLAEISSVDAAFALASRQSLLPIRPEFIPGDPPMLVLPGDPLHSVARRHVDGGSRFVLRNERFVSESPAG